MTLALGQLYEGLRAADEIVAKAAGVREVARIARIETLLRQYIHGEWLELAKEAAQEAAQQIRRGRGLVTERDTDAVLGAIDRSMSAWARRVTPRFIDDIEAIYRLARVAAHRKGTGQTLGSLQYNTKPFSRTILTKQLEPELSPSFDVADEEAIEQLRRNQTFWIGQHYDANVRESIGATVRETIVEQGRDRVAAGRLMESIVASQLKLVRIPSGFTGTAKSYFEGLVANAATVARAQGQLRSFDRLGFTRYEIVNPSDRRTCPVCDHMDGKIFTVDQGRALMEEELTASTPDDVRRIHPWLGLTGLKEISQRAGPVGSSDARRLSDAGFQLPPFHFRCRCTVDVTEEGL